MSQLGNIAKANEHVILTGQADGSVKLFAGKAQMVLTLPGCMMKRLGAKNLFSVAVYILHRFS